MTSSLELVTVACIVRVRSPIGFFGIRDFPSGFQTKMGAIWNRGRWDAKNNDRDYGIARNFGSGLRDWRTQLGTIYCNIIDQSKRCIWMEVICLSKSRKKRPKISHSSIECYFDTSIEFRHSAFLLLTAITTSKYKNTNNSLLQNGDKKREKN